MDVPEAQLEQTEHGLVYKGDGWFVVNAEDVRWRESEGAERSTNFGVDSRERHTELGPDGVRRGKEGESPYTVDAKAIEHGTGIGPETPQDEAYSRFPPRRYLRYGGWLTT